MLGWDQTNEAFGRGADDRASVGKRFSPNLVLPGGSADCSSSSYQMRALSAPQFPR